MIDDGSTAPIAGALFGLAGPTLRGPVNPNSGGAARTPGVMLFFLDDDRKVSGYPAAMLALAAAQPALAFFHSFIRTSTTEPRPRLRRAVWRTGVCPKPWRSNAALPGWAVASGSGGKRFLISAASPKTSGPTKTPTGQCARLPRVKGGGSAPKPVVEVLIHAAEALASCSAGPITGRANLATRAACFAAILQRNAAFFTTNLSASSFILCRLLKIEAKTRKSQRGNEIIAAEPEALLRLRLRADLAANLWLYRRR